MGTVAERGLRNGVKRRVQTAATFISLCGVSRKARTPNTTTAHQGRKLIVRMRQETQIQSRATRRERVRDGGRNRRQNRIAADQPATVEMSEPRAGEGGGALSEPRLQRIRAVVRRLPPVG